VNYSVRKFAGYGKLSGKSLDELRAGERVAVQDGKEDPLDFVLWKSAKPGRAGRRQVGQPLWHGPSRLAHRMLGHELRHAGRNL
jgi:cysteinyl-tRNA synthetase